MQSVSTQVNEALENRPISIQLRGLVSFLWIWKCLSWVSGLSVLRAYLLTSNWKKNIGLRIWTKKQHIHFWTIFDSPQYSLLVSGGGIWCLSNTKYFYWFKHIFCDPSSFNEIQTCMKGSPAKARVVYAPVLEVGGEGRLARACSILLNFDEVIFFK